MFEVIEVNKINNNKKPGIIPSSLIGGRRKLGFVNGEINNPEIIKNANKLINTKVNSNKVLIAIFCVLKIKMLVKSIGKIDIIVTIISEIGRLNLVKTSLNTAANICAENAHVAILAIHKKKPIRKARNPPRPSLLKL